MTRLFRPRWLVWSASRRGEPMEQDVTDLLNRYREACRFLWNNFLRDPDAHIGGGQYRVSLADERFCDFARMKEILFTALVLREIGREEFEPCFGAYDKPIPFLRVSARKDTRLMINRTLPQPYANQYWDAPITRVPEKIDLAFIDYFDWNSSGYSDFAYYYVRIVGCSEHPEIVGRDALLEVLNGGVFADDQGSTS